MNKLICMAVCFAVATNMCFADVELNYGEGHGKVGFINANNHPNVEELNSEGPGSFRVVEGKLYIADSIGGKIIVVDQKGKIEKEFSVIPSGEPKRKPDFEGDPCLQIMIGDICPIKGQYGDYAGMWVSDSLKNRLLEFDKAGKLLRIVKNEKFVQIGRIEMGLGGHLFVADEGAEKIFILDEDGKIITHETWDGYGLAVSGLNENLSRLCYSEENEAIFFVMSNLNNALVKEILLDIPGMMNPKLWWVDEDSKCFVISYMSNSDINEDGSISKLRVAKISFNGKIMKTGAMNVASSMRRYIEHDNYEKIYIGKCDYDKAPNGKFSIVPFEFEK